MPQINKNINKVGTGFAAFLSPPSPDVIRFTVGQPDFATPDAVVESAKSALDRGETAYTRTQGSPELCQAVSDHLKGHEIDLLKFLINRYNFFSYIYLHKLKKEIKFYYFFIFK